MKVNRKTTILSIESSSYVCSVSVSADDLMIAEYNIYERNVHDRLLANLVKRILEDNEIGMDDLDAVAVSSGPGSFTGLRIGFAIAKGLCYDGQIKFLKVPTLKAIAKEQSEFALFTSRNFIVSVIHSTENKYFTQIFDLRLDEQSEVEILTLESINHRFDNNYLIVGPAAKEINPETPEICTKLSASTINKLAETYYKNSAFTEPSEASPDYFQKFKPTVEKDK